MVRDIWGLACLAAAIAAAGLSGCSLVLSFDEGGEGGPIDDTIDGGFNLPDAAPEPDAAPADAMPMPDACTDTAWTSILEAGNFDSAAANAAWVDSGRFGGDIISNPGAYSGQTEPNMAYFVWPDPVEQSLAQTITLPATTTKLRFGGWRCFISQTPNTASASVEVNVRDDAGQLITTLVTYDNTQGTSICNWSQLAVRESDVSLEDYAGTDVVFSIEATSPNTSSVFLFDTLSLEALTCAP